MTEDRADPASASPPTHLGRFLWLRSRHPGWWHPTVTPGDPLTEGQPIGTVTTLDGAELLETITAPADSTVIFLTSSPAVAGKGLLIGLGAP